METELQVSLLTVAITIIAGVFGYFFREYRNRVKPFISIQSIEGGYTKRTERLEISESILLLLEKANFITKLNSNDYLGSLWDLNDDVRRIERNTKDIIVDLDNLLLSLKTKDTELSKKNLYSVLSYSLFEDWILRILVSDKVSIPSCSENLTEVVPVYNSEEYDGSIWFSFPQSSIQFGRSFKKHPIILSKCEPFIELIRMLDLDNLYVLFDQINSLVKKETEIAKELSPLLKEILNNHSRWELRLFLANLGKYPFLINKDAKLIIIDDNGGKYEEDCYLVRIKRNEKDEILRSDAEAPLVVGAEDDIEFSFFTRNTQAEMKKGKLLRQIFEDGSASCKLEIPLQKPGIIRNAKTRSPKVKFHSYA